MSLTEIQQAELKKLEELEYKYLKKYYNFLKFAEDELLLSDEIKLDQKNNIDMDYNYYLPLVEKLEQENEKLKSLLQKMKNKLNCYRYNVDCIIDAVTINDCQNCKQWELKQ